MCLKMYSPDEILPKLQDTGASVIVVDADLEQTLDEALNLLKPSHRIHVVTIGASAKGRPNLLEIFRDESIICPPRVEVYLRKLKNTAI